MSQSDRKQKPNNIVILTGAGISADSGIATFRASDGLWENHRVEEVATPEGFSKNPALVQRFYNERREDLLSSSIKPNPAHYALAQLQKEHSGNVTIVTQNIDDLHERAGSEKVLHMHGELLKVRCVRSQKVYRWEGAITENDRCQCCSSPQVLRPHIVWFGEMPFYMDQIYQAITHADLFIAIGTSGNVYPAAGFVSDAKGRGIETIEINLEPGINQSVFNQSIYGRAAIEVPKWVEQFLQ